jgi:hypothetical protein
LKNRNVDEHKYTAFVISIDRTWLAAASSTGIAVAAVSSSRFSALHGTKLCHASQTEASDIKKITNYLSHNLSGRSGSSRFCGFGIARQAQTRLHASKHLIQNTIPALQKSTQAIQGLILAIQNS